MLTLIALIFITVFVVITVGLIKLIGPFLLIPIIFIIMDVIFLRLIFRKKK